MPKQKGHHGLAKRLKITATGKVLRRHAGGGHLLSGKSAKRRRRMAGSALVTGPLAATIKAKIAK
jgi:large subunit ribosomal protein L35